MRKIPALSFVALVLVAGCLGGSVPAQPGTDSADGTKAQTAVTDSPKTAGTAEIECHVDRNRLRTLAVERVAAEVGADAANVTVVNDAVVTYEILGECYYTAKVRSDAERRINGVFLASNGTVADRDAVDARAERAYEGRYGKLDRDLYRRLRSAGENERIAVSISVTPVDSEVAKRAVDDDLTGKAYKEALSDEYQRRERQKVDSVAGELRSMDGATVESAGSTVRAVATPAAIRRMQEIDAIARISPRRGTTTYVSDGG
ncbi:hypothetical protein [Haladaptatus salinisoli]|uniref:hypothetical protein n=1 Tax=Haladaptatus salinisoli TaxID=2884876 RepID=UPI001D0A2607|nr:hypothetical protein [Haladaptatus salinisoli]